MKKAKTLLIILCLPLILFSCSGGESKHVEFEEEGFSVTNPDELMAYLNEGTTLLAPALLPGDVYRGIVPYLDPNSLDSLAANVEALQTSNATLLIHDEQFCGDLTIPTNITLKFIKGGFINVEEGKTLTINGHIEAGLHQIFTGKGKIKFGLSSIKEFFPQWWGAKGDGVSDDTLAIQAAIDCVYDQGGGRVFFPAGIYGATNIVLRTRVSLVGASKRNSKIMALASSELGLVQLPIGPVIYANIRELSFWGGDRTAVNPGQWAFYLEAKPSLDSHNHGGYWHSTWDNVEVRYFDSGVWFKGGETDFLLPNQFMTFTNVFISRNAKDGNSLKCTGQNGQFLHVNCHYDGKKDFEGHGTNIVLDKGPGGGPRTPSLHTFLMLTSQNAETAIYGYNVSSISVIDSWFENLDRAIKVEATSENILIRGSRFSNAASDGANEGYALYVGAHSKAAFENNYIIGDYDSIINSVSQNRGIIAKGNYLGAEKVSDGFTSNVTSQKSVSEDGELDCFGLKTIIVTSPEGAPPTITKINSSAMPGEMIFLKAHRGSITITEGGNITIGGTSTTVTFEQDQVAVLVRFDLGGKWILITK